MAEKKPTQTTAKKRPNPRAEARRAAQRRQRIIFGVAGVVVLGLVVLIAVLTTQESAQREEIPGVDDVARDVEISGDTYPRHDAGADDPAIGAPAPVISGEDFDGTPVTIGEPGRPQLLTFAASWCPACQQELPELIAWLEEGNLPDEVDLVMVSTNHDRTRGNWPPQDWYEAEGYPGPILVDDASASAAAAYGLSGTPFWVAIDDDGTIVWRGSGMIPMEQLSLLAQDLASD